MKNQKFSLTIEAGQERLRLDKVLSSHPEIKTRSRAAKLIEQGRVQLHGQSVKSSYLTRLGDVFEIVLPEPESSELQPLELPLDVVLEDSDVLVVNKPAGLVIHPAAGHLQDTLVNALIYHTSDLSMGFNEQRPGIVHRLDKETSGLLVIAKNDEAHLKLAEQFQKRTTHRMYWAVVFGKPKKSNDRIKSHLARHPNDRKRFASSADASKGKLAITNYELIETCESGLSLLKVKLETGRTHQIRVHLSELTHPIAGDDAYGGVKRANGLKSVHLRKLIQEMDRFALHATELGFHHPRSGQWLEFKATWPEDLQPLIAMCGFKTC